MSTIRLTLNETLEEIIQELEANYRTMSRTEILKMVIAEFYNARFGNSTKVKQTNKQKSSQNSQIVNTWLDTKVEPEMEKGELEEVFGDWWSENKAELRK